MKTLTLMSFLMASISFNAFASQCQTGSSEASAKSASSNADADAERLNHFSKGEESAKVETK